MRRIGFGGGRTNIAAALKIVDERIFTSSGGDRQNAPNIVILMTDGGSNVIYFKEGHHLICRGVGVLLY